MCGGDERLRWTNPAFDAPIEGSEDGIGTDEGGGSLDKGLSSAAEAGVRTAVSRYL